jgi:hypothetical protein
LVTFDGPVRIRLTRDYSTSQGGMIPKDTVREFDAQTAARIINLEFGEVAADG